MLTVYNYFLTDGTTPLHLAALNGREDVVQFLIEKGAFINPEDADENTPLHAAARGGHAAVAGLLFDKGASLKAKNKLGLTPGGAALASGHVEVAEKLIEKGWEPEERPLTYSLLHVVAGTGRPNSVNWLLEQGIRDVNDAKNADKSTPLHCAASSGDLETCSVLLEAGADKNVLDAAGQLPLDLLPSATPVAILTKLKQLLKPSEEILEKAAKNRAEKEQNRGITSAAAVSSSSSSNALGGGRDSPAASTASSQAQSPTNPSPRDSFLALSPEDRLRRVRYWCSLNPRDLKATFDWYPNGEEVIKCITAAEELRRTIEVFKAMSSLRGDEEFQQDMAHPEVYDAVLKLKQDPSQYDRLSSDLRVKSVVAKMGRIHAAVQSHGQRTFAIEDLIVSPKEVSARRENDREGIEIAQQQWENKMAAAVAAAAATSTEKQGEAAKEQGIHGSESGGKGERAAGKTAQRKASANSQMNGGGGLVNVKHIPRVRPWRRAVVVGPMLVALWLISVVLRKGLLGGRFKFFESDCDDGNEIIKQEL